MRLYLKKKIALLDKNMRLNTCVYVDNILIKDFIGNHSLKYCDGKNELLSIKKNVLPVRNMRLIPMFMQIIN